MPVGDSVAGVSPRAQDGRATARLAIEGRACGQVEIPSVMYIISSIGPSVGYDHGSPVSDRYESPFTFSGTLERVDIQIVTARDAAAEMSRQ